MNDEQFKNGRESAPVEREACASLAAAAAHVLMLIDAAVDNFPQSELEPLREALRRCAAERQRRLDQLGAFEEAENVVKQALSPR